MEEKTRGRDEMGAWLEELGRQAETVVPDPAAVVSRRSVFKLMGASAALLVGSGCFQRKPERKIVSAVPSPEYQQPGEALYYASTWTEGPYPYGMIVKTVDGRPVKIEGNPAHPTNAGASDAAMQASVLGLYDPDRLRAPLRSGKPISWAEVDDRIASALTKARSAALVTRATLGPSERSLVQAFLAALPQARHFVIEAVHDGPRRNVWRKSFGADGVLDPRFDLARVVLAIDSDFLATDGAPLEAARRFLLGRRLDDQDPGASTPSRLYVAEGAFTLTGANADHRLRLRPSAAFEFVKALRSAIRGDSDPLASVAGKHQLDEKVLKALAGDLASNRGRVLIVAGPHLPEAVHAEVLLLNADLGALGSTLEWNPAPPVLSVSDPSEVESALGNGVDVLVCLGVNPVYDSPRAGFEALVRKARLSVGHGLYLDETLSACTFALPSSHNLESWNDASPRPGVSSLCQPVILPLHASRQEAESLLLWTRRIAKPDAFPAHTEDWHGYVYDQWRTRHFPDAADPVRRWEDALRDGVLVRPSEPALPDLNRDVAESIAQAGTGSPGGLELVVLPHPALHDGRFANNPWLQELPDALTKIVWDNVAALAPGTARELSVEEGDVLELKVDGGAVELPVLVQPGMVENLVATTLGHGRTRAGRVGDGVGVSLAPLLRSGATPGLVLAVEAKKTGRTSQVVRVQKHSSMEDRPIVIDGTFSEFVADPRFVRLRVPRAERSDIYPPVDYSKGHKWAMAIDLSACTGCGGCVVACQAENNGPPVGKIECGRGREMHWLHLDRYFRGPEDRPEVLLQPMLCQQCDNAPCENVCPVNATTHSSEGINQQVYNRCIGTRYCSNNCPYKVRRFNFFDYQARRLRDPIQELAFNPQVTVRSRGVMEKCTFCIQRVNAAKFQASNLGEKLADGAVRTACQQACPTGAIVFGDSNDPESRVARLRASPRAYHVLEELSTRPNVTYLAKIRNPHPDLAGRPGGGHP